MRAEVVHDSGTPGETQSGAPAVVYVPGIDGTGELLLGTAKRIEAQNRLMRVRYIHEGMDGDAALYEHLADSIAQRMEEAQIRGAIVLAESFGGGVALTLALRHPDLVCGLMLVNTFCYYPQRVRIRLGAALVPFTPKRLLSLGRMGLAGKLFFRPRKDPEAEALFKQAIPGFAAGGYAERMKAIPELDLRDRLADVTLPCDLYCASHDTVVPSKVTMRVLHKGLPNSTLTIVERANHIILPLSEEPWVERLAALAARAAV